MKNDYEIRGEVTIIFTNNNREVVINTEDLPKLLSSDITRWTTVECSTVKGKFYVRGHRRLSTGRYTKVYLHRFLIDAPKGKVVDHINGNPLINTRDNLRAITQAQNLQNKHGAQTNSKTGIKGVFKRSDCDRWEAQVVVNRKKIRSLHLTKEEAIAAVIELRKKHLPFSTEGCEAS